MVNFLNVYGPGLAILFVVFVEAAGVFWFYGVENFSNDVEMMIGQRPGLFWRVCWLYISPVCSIHYFHSKSNMFSIDKSSLKSSFCTFF